MDTQTRIQAVRERLRTLQTDERRVEGAGPPCVDCIFYRPPPPRAFSAPPIKREPVCEHLVYTQRQFDPIHRRFAELMEVSAKDARAQDGLCGPEGLLFEPRAVAVVKEADKRFRNTVIGFFAFTGVVAVGELIGDLAGIVF